VFRVKGQRLKAKGLQLKTNIGKKWIKGNSG
jgi:hypothetical protein